MIWLSAFMVGLEGLTGFNLMSQDRRRPSSREPYAVKKILKFLEVAGVIIEEVE